MSEKEVEDALYMLLNCSLKDTKYTTQKEQFEVVKKYIAILEKENHKLKQWDKNKDTRNSRQRVDNKKLIEQNYKIIRKNVSLKQALNEIKDKILCYGETFDSDTQKQFQKECLQIIDNHLGDEK